MHSNRYDHGKGEWIWVQALTRAALGHARIEPMANSRSWMEKAVRSAIQRHHRGWSPYPHVRVEKTSHGHRVHWSDPVDILNKGLQVVIDSVGMPSKRDFKIQSVKGWREWTSDDGRMMERDEHLAKLFPLTHGASRVHLSALSLDECRTAMEHLRLVWGRHAVVNRLLTLVEAQHFDAPIALRTALDALACVSREMIECEESEVAPFARIAVGHAMQSETSTWACSFGHSAGKWSSMVLLAWGQDDDWRVCIIPQGNPIVYSDYAWSMTDKGVAFTDKLSPESPSALRPGRGSYERYQKIYRKDSVEEKAQVEAFEKLLSKTIVPTEPDDTWLQPIAHAVSSGLHKEKTSGFSPEYYSLMRAFEEGAFDYLRAHARTPQGHAVVAAMHVARSLEEPPRNIAQWFSHLERWALAIAGAPTVDLHDFTFEASV